MKKFIAFILALAMALSIMAEPISAAWALVGAAGALNRAGSSGPEGLENPMHFIVRHWHTSDDPTDIDSGLLEEFNTAGSEGSSSLDNLRFRVIDGYIGKVSDSFVFYVNDGMPDSDGQYNYVQVESGDGRYYSLDKINGAITFNAFPYFEGEASNPDYIEEFTGFSVSVGHGALEKVVGQNSLTVTYDENVHLVKSHVFYKSKSITVAGTHDNTVFGNNAISDGLEEDTAFVYAYTEKVGDHEVGDIVCDANGAVIKYDENDAYLPEGLKGKVEKLKVYNTNMGLHTDKTASVNKSDDRTFDLDLEAWFIGGNFANVGMILDASGSMSFTSDKVNAINAQALIDSGAVLALTAENIAKVTGAELKDVLAGNVQLKATDWEKFFIPLDKLNQVLDPHNTDNSKLGYSGYSYYVYDPYSTTMENVPLAYWDGAELEAASGVTRFVVDKDLPGRDSLIGYYAFNKDNGRLTGNYRDWLLNSVTGEYATVVKKVDSTNGDYEFADAGVQSDYSDNWGSYPLKFDPNNGLKLTSSTGAVLLDAVPSGSSFTISFAVQNPSNDSGSSVPLKEMMYIGPRSGVADTSYYRVYKDGGTSRSRLRTTIRNDNKDYISNLNSVFNRNAVIHVTLVFDGNNLKTYISGKLGDEIADKTFDESKVPGEFNIIINGLADSFTDNEVYIDNICVFDTALGAKDIETLYKDYQKAGKVPVSVVTEATDRAVVKDSSGNILATLDTAISINNFNAAKDAYKGWYYATSQSIWTTIYQNDKIGTGKDFRPLYDVAKDKPMVYTYEYTDENNADNSFSVSYTPAADEPLRFFVAEDGTLYCFFAHNPDVNSAYCSPVYENTDKSYIKVETLQRALSTFVTQLDYASPESRVSAVRFSTNNADKEDGLDKLLLLDWTNDVSRSSGVLSLNKGDGSSTGYELSKNGKKEYNYGLTGGTYTYTGLQSFIENLLPDDDADAKKYLIIFTDGKDDELTNALPKGAKYSNLSPEELERAILSTEAYNLAKTLKEQEGYTIFTVMLTGGPITYGSDEYLLAREFLYYLSGNADTSVKDVKNGGYFYSTSEAAANAGSPAGYNSADVLTRIFTDEILKQIAENLTDYSVMDYIDPRFDLVDAEGKLWKLEANGKVEVEDGATYTVDTSNGKKIALTKSSAAEESARSATLYFDAKENMYYLQWTGQTIPCSSTDATELPVWNAIVTARAKADFIGGNGVMTNGNGALMNYVFDEADRRNASSGSDKMEKDNNNKSPSKGFPRTVVNVPVPDINLEGGDQVIYMGDKLTEASVIAEMIAINLEEAKKDTTSMSYLYWDYFERYVEYYVRSFDNRTKTTEELVIELISKMLDTDNNPEFENGLPYYYIPGGDTTQTGSKTHHEKDLLGYIKFEWKEQHNGGAKYPEGDGTTTDTKTRISQLTVKYEPLPTIATVRAGYADRASYIENVLYNDKGDYKWDSAYKPAAGKENSTSDKLTAENTYTTEIVKGEIVLLMKLKKADLEKLAAWGYNGSDDKLVYTASVNRDGKPIGTLTADFGDFANFTSALYQDTEYVYVPATLTLTEQVDTDTPVKGLPLGTYTLTEKSSSTGNVPFVFEDEIKVRPLTSDDTKYFKVNNGSDVTKEKATIKESTNGSEIILGYDNNDAPKLRFGIAEVTGGLEEGKVTISKTVNGYPLTSNTEDYKFTVEIYNGNGDEVENYEFATNGTPATVKSGDTLTLKDGESITITLPVGFKVVVTETDTGDKYTYDTVYSVDGTDSKDKATVGSVSKDGNKVDVVNNTEVGDLVVVKNVNKGTANSIPDDEFTFNITLTPPADMKLSTSYDTVKRSANVDTVGTLTLTIDETTGVGTGTFTLKNTESFTIKNLPIGTTYSITEDEQNNYVIGYAAGKDSFDGKIETAGAAVTLVVENKLLVPELDVEKKVSTDGTNFEDDLVVKSEATLTYKIVVESIGEDGSVYEDVVLTDVLDKELTIIGNYTFEYKGADGVVDSSINVVPTVNAATNTITWELGDMPKGSVVTVTYQVKFPNTDGMTSVTYKNVASVPGDSDTVVVSNNPGQLIVTKDVVNSKNEPISDDTEFTFTVTFTPPTGVTLKDVKITKTDADGNVGDEEVFDLTAGTFTLKNGESVSITNLPTGTKYEVKETANANYTASVDTISGYIVNKESAALNTAKFVNTLNPASVEIDVTKNFEGELPANTDFDFVITAELIDGKNVTIQNKSVTFTFNAEDSQSEKIKFEGLDEGTYTIKVKELAVPAIPNVTYDEVVYTLTVVVARDATSGKLVATVTKTEAENAAADWTEADGIVFTNCFEFEPVDVNVALNKVLNGKELTAGLFTFEYTLTDENGKSVLTDANGDSIESDTVTNDENGSIAINFTFAKPGVYTLTVSEQKVDGAPYIYSTNTYTVTYTVTYNKLTGKLEVASAATGSTTFENTYNPTPATAEIKGTKTVTGDYPANADYDGLFSFTLSAAKDVPMPAGYSETTVGRSLTVNNSGSEIDFGTITYTAAGTYYYTITENDDNVPGFTRDSKTVTVAVEVTDTDGVLSAVVTYDGDDEFSFTNAYSVAPTGTEIEVTKNLTGILPAAGRYTFNFKATLKTVDGNAPESGVETEFTSSVTIYGPSDENTTETATAKFVFDYDKAGEYVYEIVEEGVDTENMKYDHTVYTVTVTVKDDGDGKLYVDSVGSIPADSIVFNNKYETKGATATPTAKKVLDADPAFRTLKDGEFEFELTFVEGDETGIVMPPVTTTSNKITTTNEADGTVKFGEIKFTKAGTYKVQIKEVKPDTLDPAIKYDYTPVVITYIVEDNGGVLEVTSTSYDQNGGIIRNVYTEPGDLKVTKNVTGTAGELDRYFNFTVTLDDDTINGIYGDMEFENGVAHFTLKHGESVTAKSLPSGTHFEVTEDDADTDNYVTTYNDNEGEIVSYACATVSVVNTRNMRSLTVEKIVSGKDTSGEFEFEVTATFNGAPVSGTYGDMTFVDGVAEFTLKHLETKTATYLPEGTHYVVKEVNVGDNYDVVSSGEEGDIPEHGDVKAVFVNARNDVLGSLSITKVVNGEGSDKEDIFEFTVKLTDANGKPLAGEYDYANPNDKVNGQSGKLKLDANGEAKIYLTHLETITIYNLPVGTKYTVTEKDYTSEGYVTESVGETGVIPLDGSDDRITPEFGAYVAGGAAATFINTKQLGALTVSKVITGDIDEDVDYDKEFEFTVTFTGNVVDGKEYSGLTFNGGVASTTFTLKHGESKYFTGIPAGVTYTIVETPDTDGYVQVLPIGDAGGTIKANEVSVVTYVNRKDIDKGGLVVSKTVTGEDGDKNKEFDFTVTLIGKVKPGTYGDMTFDENGVATFTLKHGESKIAYDLPAGITYVVEENADGYTSYSKGAIGTIVADTFVTAAFVNSSTSLEGTIVVTKVVTGNYGETTRDFNFTVTLGELVDVFGDPVLDENGEPVKINGVYGDMEFVDGVAHITLKHGEIISATGLPFGVPYTVTEDGVEGLIAEGYTVIGGESGIITADMPIVYVVFHNDRTVPTGGLTVVKTVKGDIYDQTFDPELEFGFTVTLSDPMINGWYGEMFFLNGVANFSLKHGASITATDLPENIGYEVVESGSYGYTLVEKIGDSGIIIADTTVTASFVNERDPDLGSLRIMKIVGGDDGNTEKEFDFKLTITNYNLSGVYGDLTFDNSVAEFKLAHKGEVLVKNLPAGAEYIVEEIIDESERYDTSYIHQSGTIEKNATVAVVVTNERWLKLGSLEVTKGVTNDVIDYDAEFNFTVTLGDAVDELGNPIRDKFGNPITGESINGVYGDMTFENGVANFTLKHGESKSATNLPAGMTYKVEEEEDEKFVVEKYGDEGTIETGKVSTVTFFNHKEEFGELVIEKIVVDVYDRVIDDDTEFNFEIVISGPEVNGEYDGVVFTDGRANVTVKGGESITITGLPANAAYIVKEIELFGYSCTNAVTQIGTIPANGSALARYFNRKSASIDYPNVTAPSGSLTIMKTVTGTDGEYDREFTFTVSLTNAFGQPVPGSFYYYGTKNGSVSHGGIITLKHGDFITISGLPSGTNYVITEMTPDDYSCEAVGNVGIISDNYVSVASFINSKDIVDIDRPTQASYNIEDAVEESSGSSLPYAAVLLTVVCLTAVGAAALRYRKVR